MSEVGDDDRSDGVGGPARGYSWAPFEAGNEVALKHGMFSPRRVEPLADGVVQSILTLAADRGASIGYLRDPSYRPALWAYARCEARIQLGTEWLLDVGGDVTGDGEVRSVAEYVRRLEAQALKHRERLGLDPLSRAKIQRDRSAAAVDVARLMAELDDETDEVEPIDVVESSDDGDEDGENVDGS